MKTDPSDLHERIAEALLDPADRNPEGVRTLSDWMGYLFSPTPAKNPNGKQPLTLWDYWWEGTNFLHEGKQVGAIKAKSGQWYTEKPRPTGPYRKVTDARKAVVKQVTGRPYDFEVRVPLRQPAKGTPNG